MSQPLADDDRTPRQRRADALVEISKVALDEGRVPEVNGVRPHVQVTASVETLLGLAGAPAAELEGAGPISVEMLRRLAVDCSLRRVLLDSESMVIDVGRANRLFRGATRIALERRDGGCVWRGCTRPARYCQADHIKEWWKDGTTDVSNGRLLCRYHHRLRSDGWELVETDEGWVPKPPIWSLFPRGSPEVV
jgi:hypothetical protein